MKIFYVSDIHLEFYDCRKIRSVTANSKAFEELREHGCDFDEDCIVLAGDVGWVSRQLYQEFLKALRELCANIYILAGNHEFYCPNHREPVAKIRENIQKFCNENEITFLDRSTKEFKGVLFAGATLWYNPGDVMARARVKEKLNDYVKIYARPFVHPPNGSYSRVWNSQFMIQPDDVALWNETETAFFQKVLEDAETDNSIRSVICVSHHPPTMHFSKERGYCNTDLQVFIDRSSKLKGWICGHNHMETPQCLPLNETSENSPVIMCNTFGYKGEFPHSSQNFRDTKDLPRLRFSVFEVS